METIYVYLLESGTDVWRPTRGRRLTASTWEVLATAGYDPGLEKWQFVPGTVVECVPRRLEGVEVLVAVRRADSGDDGPGGPSGRDRREAS